MASRPPPAASACRCARPRPRGGRAGAGEGTEERAGEGGRGRNSSPLCAGLGALPGVRLGRPAQAALRGVGLRVRAVPQRALWHRRARGVGVWQGAGPAPFRTNRTHISPHARARTAPSPRGGVASPSPRLRTPDGPSPPLQLSPTPASRMPCALTARPHGLQPVVVSHCGGPGEFVRNGIDGIHVQGAASLRAPRPAPPLPSNSTLRENEASCSS